MRHPTHHPSTDAPTPRPHRTAAAALALALLSAGAAASRLAPQGSSKQKRGDDGVAFATRPAVTLGKAVGWGPGGRGGVVLQPAGCTSKCNGYTQSSGEERTNEMYSFGIDRATFERGDGSSAGSPAPFMRVQLRNRGLAMPADVGAAITNMTVNFAPVGVTGGEPPAGSEPFDVTFGVMWTPGAGTKPNTAGLFSLVNPLPTVKFTADGVQYQFTVSAGPVGGKGQVLG